MGRRARDPAPGKLDPAVSAAGERGWRQWAEEVGEDEQRVAEFGLALVLGLVGGVLCLVAFAWLANEMLASQTQQMDDATLAYLRTYSSPTLDRVAFGLSLFGSEIVVLVAVVLLGVFAWQRRWGAAGGLLLVTIGAQVLNDVLKELFHRTRPAPMLTGPIDAQQFSFPSGHAMVAAAFYFFLAYLAWRLVRGRWRTLLVVGLVLLVLLIGLSRLYLGAHFLSDVIAGFFVGFLWTDAVILGSRALVVRRRRPRVSSTGAAQAAGLDRS